MVRGPAPGPDLHGQSEQRCLPLPDLISWPYTRGRWLADDPLRTTPGRASHCHLLAHDHCDSAFKARRHLLSLVAVGIGHIKIGRGVDADQSNQPDLQPGLFPCLAHDAFIQFNQSCLNTETGVMEEAKNQVGAAAQTSKATIDHHPHLALVCWVAFFMFCLTLP